MSKFKTVAIIIIFCVLVYAGLWSLTKSWHAVGEYCVPANQGLSPDQLHEMANEQGLRFHAASLTEYIVSGSGPDSPVCIIAVENGIAQQLTYQSEVFKQGGK